MIQEKKVKKDSPEKKKRKKNVWVKEVMSAKKKNKISFKEALLLASTARKKKTNYSVSTSKAG